MKLVLTFHILYPVFFLLGSTEVTIRYESSILPLKNPISFSGKFGSSWEAIGQLGHYELLLPNEGNELGCKKSLTQKNKFFYLLQEGGCSIGVKSSNAYFSGAAAVFVFEKTEKMLSGGIHSPDKILSLIKRKSVKGSTFSFAERLRFRSPTRH